MKFNNLMNQKKYIISVRGLVSRAGVSTAAWAVSSDGPVAAAFAYFSAWGGEGEWDGGSFPASGGGGEGGGNGSGARCAEKCSMRVEILS